jgi:glutamate synthase (ferredoxin)
MMDSPLPWLTEERDACGVGFIADRRGRASHDLVTQALAALACLEHRGGCSADSGFGGWGGAVDGPALGNFAGVAEAPGLPPLVRGRTGVGMVFLRRRPGRWQEWMTRRCNRRV